MPRNILLTKGLVLGVILLFIGVGIQPAFAVSTNFLQEGEVETIINTDISHIENDCDCQTIDKPTHIRVERTLDKLESYTKILSLLSRTNPDWDAILTILMIIFCLSLLITSEIFLIPAGIFLYLSNVFEKIPILYELFLSIGDSFLLLWLFFFRLFGIFCLPPFCKYNCVQKRVLSLIPEL